MCDEVLVIVQLIHDIIFAAFKRQINEVRVLVNDLAKENNRLTLEKNMLQDQVRK